MLDFGHWCRVWKAEWLQCAVRALRLGRVKVQLRSGGTDGSEHVYLRSPSAAPVHRQTRKVFLARNDYSKTQRNTGSSRAGSAPLARFELW